MAKTSEAVITNAEHNGHFLSFHESTKSHRYIFDGRRVPGSSTFPKGGYPASEGLTSWMLSRTADAAVRVGIQEAKYAAYAIEHDDDLDVRFEPISEDRIAELVKEAKKKPDEEADAAGDVGSILHDYAYLTELGKAGEALSLLRSHEGHPDYARIKLCVDQFDVWYASVGHADTIVSSEQIVGWPCGLHLSKEDSLLGLARPASPLCLCYAGKFDRLVQRKDKLILSDFKTASGIYHDTPLQLMAYKRAIEYWLGGVVDGIEILNFSKKTGKFAHVLIDQKEDLEAFDRQMLRCRETYAFKQHFSADKRFAYTPKKKED